MKLGQEAHSRHGLTLLLILLVLASLDAEEELAVRLALQGEFANLRGNRPWKARIDALWRALALDEDGVARVLRQAERSGKAIVAIVRRWR
jgi:hypothetical protein